MQEPQESDALIAIVDDDPSVRRGLQRLIRSAGWKAEMFASAQEFLARPLADAPSCLVLDLQLPGLSGLHLQQRMAASKQFGRLSNAIGVPDSSRRKFHDLRRRYESLTAREQEVMQRGSPAD